MGINTRAIYFNLRAAMHHIDKPDDIIVSENADYAVSPDYSSLNAHNVLSTTLTNKPDYSNETAEKKVASLTSYSLSSEEKIISVYFNNKQLTNNRFNSDFVIIKNSTSREEAEEKLAFIVSEIALLTNTNTDEIFQIMKDNTDNKTTPEMRAAEYLNLLDSTPD